MEFAKYYNVTKKLNQMLEKKLLSSYTKDYCEKLFICEDTHDFQICRVIKGFNEDYEPQSDKWLIEHEKINKYDICNFIKEKKNDNSEIKNRQDRDFYIDECFSADEIIEFIILIDDNRGLQNGETRECNGYDEVVEIIDEGFGIIEYELPNLDF